MKTKHLKILPLIISLLFSVQNTGVSYSLDLNKETLAVPSGMDSDPRANEGLYADIRDAGRVLGKNRDSVLIDDAMIPSAGSMLRKSQEFTAKGLVFTPNNAATFLITRRCPLSKTSCREECCATRFMDSQMPLDMPFDMFKKAVDDLDGVDEIFILGGEPFSYGGNPMQLAKLVKCAAARAKRVTVITNGYYFANGKEFAEIFTDPIFLKFRATNEPSSYWHASKEISAFFDGFFSGFTDEERAKVRFELSVDPSHEKGFSDLGMSDSFRHVMGIFSVACYIGKAQGCIRYTGNDLRFFDEIEELYPNLGPERHSRFAQGGAAKDRGDDGKRMSISEIFGHRKEADLFFTPDGSIHFSNHTAYMEPKSIPPYLVIGNLNDRPLNRILHNQFCKTSGIKRHTPAEVVLMKDVTAGPEWVKERGLWQRARELSLGEGQMGLDMYGKLYAMLERRMLSGEADEFTPVGYYTRLYSICHPREELEEELSAMLDFVEAPDMICEIDIKEKRPLFLEAYGRRHPEKLDQALKKLAKNVVDLITRPESNTGLFEAYDPRLICEGKGSLAIVVPSISSLRYGRENLGRYLRDVLCPLFTRDTYGKFLPILHDEIGKYKAEAIQGANNLTEEEEDVLEKLADVIERFLLGPRETPEETITREFKPMLSAVSDEMRTFQSTTKTYDELSDEIGFKDRLEHSWGVFYKYPEMLPELLAVFPPDKRHDVVYKCYPERCKARTVLLESL